MRVRESVGVALIVGVVVGVTLLPYLYGHLTCPPDKTFLGLVGQNGADQAFYLGWGPKQAQNGHLLFEDKYNGHADRRAVFNLLWLIMGWSARLTGQSVLAVFHLERTLSSIALLLCAHRLITQFETEPARRLLALALLATASGFGALLIPWNAWGSPEGIFSIRPETWTPDLWVVESNVFLTMLWEAMLPAATALLLLTLGTGFNSLVLGTNSAHRAGLLTLLLGSVYPYGVISVYGILGLLALSRVHLGRAAWRRTLGAYAVIVTIALPVVLYDGYLVLTDPRLTTGQAGYASPDLLRYAFSFGVLAPLAAAGAWLAARRGTPHDQFLLVWIVATGVMIYIPRALIPFQMELILGIQLPLVVLAVRALAAATAGHPRVQAIAYAGVLAVSTLTSVYHLNNVFVGLERRALPEYIDHDLENAIGWLAGHTQSSAVVLSSPEVAPYIPVLANNRMYAGNYEAPTADFASKQARIEWLFAGPPRQGAAVVRLLREERIDYVFYDRDLLRLGGAELRARLDGIPELTAVFRNAAVSIYRVGP